MVLWIYGFMVLWIYGFMVISKGVPKSGWIFCTIFLMICGGFSETTTNHQKNRAKNIFFIKIDFLRDFFGGLWWFRKKPPQTTKKIVQKITCDGNF